MSVRDRNVTALRALIASTTSVERDGYHWAAATQDDYCMRLGGWSTSKFFRETGKPPFIRMAARIDGQMMTLLREGEPGAQTPAIIAKHMSKLLRSYRARCRELLLAERDALSEGKIGVPETDAVADVRIEKIDHLLNVLPTLVGAKDYGCMCGLAETWPDGYQVQIFKTVLADWEGFMAGEKIAIWTAGTGEERFFEYVSMSVLRAFPEVAVELWVMEQQEKAGELTPELRKISRFIEK